MLLRYAARINGLTELFLTKLDVLSGLETLRVATSYRYGGESFDDAPPHQSIVHKAEPVYEELEGWSESLEGITSFGALPAAARAYVLRLVELGAVPIRHVSVGPGREETLEVPAA